METRVALKILDQEITLDAVQVDVLLSIGVFEPMQGFIRLIAKGIHLSDGKWAYFRPATPEFRRR
jgi:hypothetical protein